MRVLHPKSRFTSSLFATTVFASFFVVLLPHVLPCPAPRGSYTDDGSSSPARKRRRRVIVEAGDEDEDLEGGLSIKSNRGGIRTGPGPDGDDREEEIETERGARRERRDRMRRECPVPKPSGLVGEILGFNNSTSTTGTVVMENGRGGEGLVKARAGFCPVPTRDEMFGFKRVYAPANSRLQSSTAADREAGVGRSTDTKVGRPP